MEKKFCAHRGVSKLIPQNTLPAFGAALALGADEIEFDVRLSKDGQLMVYHDILMETVTDVLGNVGDYTAAELKQICIEPEKGWRVPLCTVEEVFRQFANKLTFNIHVKEAGEDGYVIRELVKLIDRYAAWEHAYFAASPNELEWMERVAPQIRRVAIQLPNDPIGILEMAKKYHCWGVQLWIYEFDEEDIRKLHEAGLVCNMFWSDNMEGYDKYYAMGVDTILTNRMDLAAMYRAQKA